MSEQEDAARYRWLRDAAQTTTFDCPRWTVAREYGGFGETYRGETLDTEIDQAMAEAGFPVTTWIRVDSERLPEPFSYAWTYDSRLKRRTIIYWTTPSTARFGEFVTHWKPLYRPEEPEDV